MTARMGTLAMPIFWVLATHPVGRYAEALDVFGMFPSVRGLFFGRKLLRNRKPGVT